MKERLEKIKSYIPRHFRLGVCCLTPQIVSYTDVIEDVPIVGDDGIIAYSVRMYRQQTSVESMSKYKYSELKLKSLVEAGIPLKVVNINKSNSLRIDELERICLKFDAADKYVERVQKDIEERASWFSQIEKDNDLDNDVVSL